MHEEKFDQSITCKLEKKAPDTNKHEWNVGNNVKGVWHFATEASLVMILIRRIPSFLFKTQTLSAKL